MAQKVLDCEKCGNKGCRVAELVRDHVLASEDAAHVCRDEREGRKPPQS